jgi:hypothetical protein
MEASKFFLFSDAAINRDRLLALVPEPGQEEIVYRALFDSGPSVLLPAYLAKRYLQEWRNEAEMPISAEAVAKHKAVSAAS